MRANRYAAKCACGREVDPGEGIISGPPWRVQCLGCAPAEERPTQGKLPGHELVSQQLGAQGDSLWDYQRTGAAWLEGRTRALLSDDQGLGKTVQVLCALPRGAKVLIVCPAVVKSVWVDHVLKLRPDFAAVLLSGRDAWHRWEPGDVAITSWSALPKKLTEYPQAEVGRALGDLPTHVVYDEAHYAKTVTARRTRRARALTRVVECAWGLTGTPLKNRPPDLWGVLSMLDLQRRTWPSWAEFLADWGGRKGRWGTVWVGERSEGIAAKLRTVMLRRLKEDVLPDLPEKRRDTITVYNLDAATRKACDAATRALTESSGADLDELLELALSTRAGAKFEELARACRALAIAKLPALIDLLDVYEGESDQPRLVWSRHVAPLTALAKARDGWEALTGGTTSVRRAELVEAFQRGELRGLALSIGAAATGITLTKASHAIYLDRAWSPSDNWQSEDRIHRIGQRNACRYTTLVADHELDRALSRILNDKTRTIKSTVDEAARR